MNIHGQVSYQIWLRLPKDVRDKLVGLFTIPRSGSTVVDYGPNGNVVVSDGYKPEDIEAITLEKMQVLMGSESTNFYELFGEVVEKVMRAELPVIFYDDTPGKIEVKDLPKPIDTITHTGKVPFCNTCDSRGVRHKKQCPKYKPTR